MEGSKIQQIHITCKFEEFKSNEFPENLWAIVVR
jgi:hypothetical protein